jgi:chitobiase/beta-hexosaminidase-like protein
LSSLMSGTRVARRRTRAIITTAAALAAASALAGPAGAAVTSPHSINVFYHRDFVQGSGFQAGDRVTVDVLRNGTVIGTAANVVPTDDPTTAAFDGLVTVNHPGGVCWDKFTPDLQRGDVIRTTVANAPPTSTTAVDTTPIMDVEVTKQAFESAPGQVQIKGFAADASGNPLPLGQLTQRMVAGNQLFDLGHKRTLRAGGGGADGTLTYDPVGPGNPKGINWTATYGSTGPGVPPLDAHDVAMAVGAESRGIWLGTDPAAFSPLSGFLVESTLAEVGGDKPAVPGGSVGCPALAGNAVTSADAAHTFNGRPAINAANVTTDLTVSGVANNVTAVSATLTDANGKVITAPGTLTGAAGSPQSWTATFPAAALQTLADGPVTAAGQYTAGGQITGTTLSMLKDVVAPGAPTASPSPGTYHIAQSVTLSSSDQSATLHHTADGTAPNALSPEDNPVSVTATQTVTAVAVDPAGNASAMSSFAYTITPLAPGGEGGATPAGLAQRIPLLPVAGVQVLGAKVASRSAVHGLSVAVMRGHALRLTMRLDSGAGVVQLRVFRASHGQPTGAPLATFLRLPSANGRYAVTLRGRALRALRSGRYVLEARAGTGRAVLGAASRKAFRI